MEIGPSSQTTFHLSLWFDGNLEPQLHTTKLMNRTTGAITTALRGREGSGPDSHGYFQWSAAVRGLAILFLRNAAVSKDGGEYLLKGMRKSLASSLDFALGKQPHWLFAVFGYGTSGHTLARQLITRTNPEMKRDGPIVLGMNRTFWDGSCLEIFFDDRLILYKEQLLALADEVENLPDPTD